MNNLTQATYDRLAAELNDMAGPQRYAAIDQVTVARAMGGVTENGDYDAAREHLEQLEVRIGKLSRKLEDAVIIDELEPGVVCAGTVVSIRFDGDSTAEQYLFGDVEESSGTDLETCSPGSPLGQALSGRRVGETITYVTPSGTAIDVLIADVVPSP